MPLSMDEALSAYGFVYTLAKAVPDLNRILTQAVQESWTSDKFTATVESSDWWNTHADTARQLVTQQYTDPATYKQNLANATQLVTMKAQSLGRVIDPKTAERLALQTLTENGSWDDQRLSRLVSDATKAGHGDSGAYGGQAANNINHMTQVAQSYGVGYTTKWLETWNGLISSGRETLDSWESVMRSRAKAAYPQFAAQIDAGMTIQDIADPYIATYAQTLEVPETTVTLKDPHIKKALQQTGEDGKTRTSMPLWQFERTLKNDPRYDKTKQAKQDAFDTLAQIGRDWGLVGGGS